MAKKKEKGKNKKDSAGPRDAVRGAVESTFQAAAGGASKAQEILDDVATTLRSLREANLVETLEGVRDEVQALARRVAALELREKPTPPSRPAVRRASTSTTRRKPATAARKTTSAAKKTTTAAKKTTTAAKKTTTAAKPAARKPTARKPAAAKSTTARKPAARKSS